MRWRAIVATAILILLLTFCHRLNRPPTVPEPVYPPDGATGVPIDATLSWRSSDPDGDPITFTVFLNGEEIAQTTETSLKVSLEIGRDYSWSVTARDVYGNESRGRTWHFKTVPFPPGPNVPLIHPDGVKEITLERPEEPTLINRGRRGATFVMRFNDELEVGGCGWLEFSGKLYNVNGCVEDGAVVGDRFIAVLGDESLVMISPSTVSTLIEGYVNGVDYGDGLIAVSRGPFGMYVSTASSPSSFTKVYGGWVGEPVVQNGRVYAITSDGVLVLSLTENGWTSSTVGSPTLAFSVWNGRLFTLESNGLYSGGEKLIDGSFRDVAVLNGYALLMDDVGVYVYFIGNSTPVYVSRIEGSFVSFGKVR